MEVFYISQILLTQTDLDCLFTHPISEESSQVYAVNCLIFDL